MACVWIRRQCQPIQQHCPSAASQPSCLTAQRSQRQRVATPPHSHTCKTPVRSRARTPRCKASSSVATISCATTAPLSTALCVPMAPVFRYVRYFIIIDSIAYSLLLLLFFFSKYIGLDFCVSMLGSISKRFLSAGHWIVSEWRLVRLLFMPNIRILLDIKYDFFFHYKKYDTNCSMQSSMYQWANL